MASRKKKQAAKKGGKASAKKRELRKLVARAVANRQNRRAKRTKKGLKVKKGSGRVVYTKPRQTGKSDTKRDAKRKALPPGKRISRSGKVYYEYRKNRSDLPGSRV